MGIDSLLQQNIQNAGLAGTDRLARNAMFPQSQMDKTQYAVSTQLPTGAATIQADYDAPTNAYTGLQQQNFANGGIATLRYDDGGDVQQPVAPPQFNAASNADFANLDPFFDPDKLQALDALKTTNPKQYNAQLMNTLSEQLNTNYRTNQNYDNLWHQFAGLREQDPQEWYRKQLEFLGGQQGWQIGQNTSERNASIQPQLQDTVSQARAAGLSEDEIGQILSGSSQEARNTNVQRIAQDAAANKGGGFGGLVIPAATIAAMVVAPELAPLLAPELGAFGGALASGALTGGALGGIGAGMSGGDVGKGILMGGATGAAGAGLTSGLSSIGSIDPNIATGIKGVNTARSIYNVAQNPTNPMAAISAAKSAYNLGNTMMAARGGLMNSGGIANLGSYSDGGHLLKGPGDGMSDDIPAKIGNTQPARLADGEFVIPADVVSHLGNGSTDAGAKQLYKMMDKIRHARTGSKKQGKQINPNKYLP